MIDPRVNARRAILAGMTEIEDEYQLLRAQQPRLTELELLRGSYIRAYEALTPEIASINDARDRREAVEQELDSYCGG